GSSVPSAPRRSGRGRCRPRRGSSAPRKKLPPPTTIATCTPSCTAEAISLAMAATTSGSRPTDPPPNTSPESLSRTRRAPGDAVVIGFLPETSGRRWCCGQVGAPAGRAPDGDGTGVAPVRGRTGATPVMPLGSGAHAEPGETGDRATGLGDDLADRLLRVLRERLVEQHDLLEEAVQPPLDDLRERLLRLVLVAGGLLGDPALVGDLLGRNVLAAEVARGERGDVHRHVAGHSGTGLVAGHQHTDLRGQVLVRAVQVLAHLLAGNAGDAADHDLLAEGGGGVLDECR